VTRALVLLWILAWPLGAWADAAGRVTFLEGEAARTPPGGAAQALAMGSDVQVGDALETSAGGRLEVSLADGSVVRLDERSRATLDAAAQTAPKSWKVRLSLLAGALWSKVTRRIGPDAAYEVSTERFVAGVRGTEFLVEAADDHQVQVAEGAVEVSLREGTAAAARRFRVEAARGLVVDRELRTDGPLGGKALRPHAFFAWMREREAAGRLRRLSRAKAAEVERRKDANPRRDDRRDRGERIQEQRERRTR
jgi:ferric-dicitrate binding protein FerR (iron transport regulator)